MKTQNFTPGPWRVTGSGQNIEVVYKTGEKLAGVEMSAPICLMPHHPDKTRHKYYLANATLMAAAPDMFEALEEILFMEVRGHALIDRLQFSTEGRRIADKARAALQKAKGGE